MWKRLCVLSHPALHVHPPLGIHKSSKREPNRQFHSTHSKQLRDCELAFGSPRSYSKNLIYSAIYSPSDGKRSFSKSLKFLSEGHARRKDFGPGPTIPGKKEKYPADHCWSCNNFRKKDNTMFCNSCERIVPASQELDYFDLLALPKQFHIDSKKLDKFYQSLQKKIHPDRFQAKSETEFDISMLNSTRVTEAYKTLKDPTERAKYLLKLNGIDISDEGNGTIEDMELLSTIMDIRETLEEKPSVEELEKLKRENDEAISKSLEKFNESLDKKDLDAAKYEIIKIQYLKGLKREITNQMPI